MNHRLVIWVTFALACIVEGLASPGRTTYDYVVIGGGTAGLTVASRLSEDASINVAVIEAGPNAESLPEVFVPGLFGSGQSLTTLNWGYGTTPQPQLNNRSLTINAGKALGGSSAINAMLFPRAGRQQYDAWAELNHDSSWGWDALLPYFKNSEVVTPPNASQVEEGGIVYDPQVHGRSGRVKVGYPNVFFDQSSLWRRAAVAAGFPGDRDLSGGDPHGVGVAPESIDVSNYARCSAACAYYTPFSERPNFHVFANSTVTRIIWEGTPSLASNMSTSSTSGSLSKKLHAIAVEFLQDGSNQTQTVAVKREVILSAGTIGSPKVLELSGVGNKTILQSVGISPVFDLPSVGENLADHVHSYVSAFTNASLTFDSLSLDPELSQEQITLWFSNHTGILTSFPGSLGLAAPSNIFSNDERQKLVQDARRTLKAYAKLFSNGDTLLEKGIAAQHEIVIGLYEKDKSLPLELSLFPGYAGANANRPQRNYTTIMNVLYAPLSRGRTHITSSDIHSPPEVNPEYHVHPLDTAAHAAGVKLARKTLITPPMDQIYQGEFEPGVDAVSTEDIVNALKTLATSDNHATGTLAMMPRELGGVVDTQLRIYGIDNVRVADASIIPIPVSAHISSTVYMIGERAADMIKRSHHSQ